jgi:hypothetical protein
MLLIGFAGIGFAAHRRSFVPRFALVNQTAIVGWAVHQDTAFLTGHVPRGRFRHGNFVFGPAAACMRSDVPFYEFGHARNMSPEQPVFHP